MLIHPPELQNRPALSTPKAKTESGGVPASIAAMIFWSVRPVRLSTVIHGYCCWKPSKIFLNTAVSDFEVHSLHIESVTGACDSLGLIVCGAELSLPDPHAPASNENPATAARMVRLMPSLLLG